MLLAHHVTAALISFQLQCFNTRLSQRCWRAVWEKMYLSLEQCIYTSTHHVCSLNSHAINTTVLQYFSCFCKGCMSSFVMSYVFAE